METAPHPKTKKCCKCSKRKVAKNFCKHIENGRWYVTSTCKACDADRVRTRRISWKENGLCFYCGDGAIKGRRYCQKHLIYNTARKKRQEQRCRDRVFKVYGSVCACCGESEASFLTIDHINNDGNVHRKKIGCNRGGYRFYLWTERNGFPKFLQILCWNCNEGKRVNGGVCAHQLIKPSLAPIAQE